MESSVVLTESRFWLWPWEERRGWLSVAAVVGGAWAFAGPWNSAQLAGLAGALVLLQAGWLPFWRALTATAWAPRLSGWRDWQREAPLGRWPYLQPGTPGAVLYRACGRARAWWAAEGASRLALPLRSAVMALVVSLLAGFMVGRIALLLTLLLVAWAELAALWHAGRGTVGAGWETVALVGLPWLLGAFLQGPVTLLPALAALVLVLVVGLATYPSARLAGGGGVAALFLVWAGHPFAAGVLLLLAFPLLLLVLHRPTVELYRRASVPWLLAIVLLLAWVL